MFWCPARVLALLISLLRLSPAQVIITPPRNITVFLDQEPAVFECEVDGGLSGWRLNGTIYYNLPSEIRLDIMDHSGVSENGYSLLKLTIPARAEYNETTVQCVAFNIEAVTNGSEIMSFKVQGILSSVVDVRLVTSITILCIWSAPFSLDVTDVDPDIWYTVFIYNITDEPTTLISCTDCINITETQYTFTPDYPSPCHKYIFTIIPFNGAGQGQSSENITKNNTIPDITITRVDIRDVNSSTSTVIFTVNGEVERVCDYTLHTISDDGNGMIETLSLKNDETKGNIIYTLSDNKYYCSVYFTIESGAESFDIHQDDFTTFDVQHLSVMVNDDGDIIVTGVLITNSHAKVCFIVLQGSHNTADIYQILSQNNQSVSGTIIAPSSSHYTVYGYDIEDNTLPNALPAVASEITIVNSNNNSKPIISSTFLESASISFSGSSEVTVNCKVAQDYPEASCVLVYREYNNPLLIVTEFPQLSILSITLSVDRPENYTFAIFGKNGDSEIEEHPAVIVKPSSQLPSPALSTVDMNEETKQFPTPIVSISIAAVLVTCIIMFVLGAVFILIVKRWQKKKTKAAGAETTNVVYDYIDMTLPVISNTIPTEPNTAYATTLRSKKYYN